MESLGLGSGGKAMLLFGEAHHVQVRAMCMLHAVLACCLLLWVCRTQCACRLKRRLKSSMHAA